MLKVKRLIIFGDAVDNNYKINLAKISDVDIGISEHGIITAWITVKYDGSSSTQGYGGWALSKYNSETKTREITPAGDYLLSKMEEHFNISRDNTKELIGRSIFVLNDLKNNSHIEGISLDNEIKFYSYRHHAQEFQGVKSVDDAHNFFNLNKAVESAALNPKTPPSFLDLYSIYNAESRLQSAIPEAGESKKKLRI